MVIIGLGGGSSISFLLWVIMGAVTEDWRDATRAGAVVALIFFALAILRLMFLDVIQAIGLGLILEAFPTAMYNWGTGNAHGFAWLWITFWMIFAGAAVVGLNHLSQRSSGTY